MTQRTEPSGWAVGFTAFAGVMMIMIGVFQAATGLVAVLNQDFYVVTPNYTFALDVGTWGWIHLIFGIVLFIAGFGVMSGQTWARAAGVILAVLSAIEAFLFIPYQPFWSIIIIALCVMVIWALTTQASAVAASWEDEPRDV
jgi:hypothetical protein